MKRRNWIAVVLVGIGIALLITLFSPWASSHPDGLERVADDKGFLEEAEGPSYEIIPDYTFPGVEDERLATILSGIAGVLIVAAIAIGLGILLQSLARSRSQARAASEPSMRSEGQAGG
ncbi:MAG: PDGLE domain-containing protein [Dehalococcoidia bacterium]